MYRQAFKKSKLLSIIKDQGQNRLNPLKEEKDSLWDSDYV